MIRIMSIGFLLWAFYIVQEEFAKYGMYQLISYGVHEIASIIPFACTLVTIISISYLLWCIWKKRADRLDKRVLIVLFLCLVFEIAYLYHQSQKVSTTAICTIEEIQEKEEIIIISIEGREDRIELHSPMLVNGLVEKKEQKYLIDYVWIKGSPSRGELHMIQLIK